MYGLFTCNIAILFTTFSAKKIFPAVVVFIQTLFRIKSGKFWRTFPHCIFCKRAFIRSRKLFYAVYSIAKKHLLTLLLL